MLHTSDSVVDVLTGGVTLIPFDARSTLKLLFDDSNEYSALYICVTPPILNEFAVVISNVYGLSLQLKLCDVPPVTCITGLGNRKMPKLIDLVVVLPLHNAVAEIDPLPDKPTFDDILFVHPTRTVVYADDVAGDAEA